jgi:predicted ABC-type ATPase
MPRLLIVAGPNGAGKTYWLRHLMPHRESSILINADIIQESITDISVGLKPNSAAILASREMIRRIRMHGTKGDDFALETTLAARTYVKRILELQSKGYTIHLFFLWVDKVDTCITRVAQRVRNGGHNIPEDVIRRRFVLGLRNFFRMYYSIVDSWELYDYSDFRKRSLIARFDRGGEATNWEMPQWKTLRPGFYVQNQSLFMKITAEYEEMSRESVGGLQ